MGCVLSNGESVHRTEVLSVPREFKKLPLPFAVWKTTQGWSWAAMTSIYVKRIITLVGVHFLRIAALWTGSRRKLMKTMMDLAFLEGWKHLVASVLWARNRASHFIFGNIVGHMGGVSNKLVFNHDGEENALEQASGCFSAKAKHLVGSSPEFPRMQCGPTLSSKDIIFY